MADISSGGVKTKVFMDVSFYVAAVVKPSGVFFLPCLLWALCPWPRLVWRLPVALGPLVSNDLLSVRVYTPVTRCSLRLSTRAGRPVGGDPIYPTASFDGPETSRAASTSTQAEA
jgi:hypothetical protein